MRQAPKSDPWLSLLEADPRPALLASDEPFARFVALTAVLGAPEDGAEARAARKAVVADARVRALVDRLPDWESGFAFSGHNSPGFPPNILRLLHAMGVRAGDFGAVDRMLEAMARHQADDGRYLTPGGTTGAKGGVPAWASLPCDHFAIAESLLLFGRRDARGMRAALARVRDALVETAQGPGWPCVPDPVAKWRGPGRKNDACLQATVEALRLFGLVPAAERPRGIADAGRTLLRAWRNRKKEKPYMFGHGPRFVAGKWPPTWYDASAALEALSPHGDVWTGKRSADEDRRSATEIVRALATNFGLDGFVTPQSCYKGFETYSFGQKMRPSPWATARLCGILRRFSRVLRSGTKENRKGSIRRGQRPKEE
ncbi:MAG: hypothetical protein MUC63_01315 [Planctomycetes bacterium]|jgi:hypothetical protein|nr:hypothetical protein [Planctomycetota bacterium]